MSRFDVEDDVWRPANTAEKNWEYLVVGVMDWITGMVTQVAGDYLRAVYSLYQRPRFRPYDRSREHLQWAEARRQELLDDIDAKRYFPDLAPLPRGLAPSQLEERPIGTGAASSHQVPGRHDDDTSGSQPTVPHVRRIHKYLWSLVPDPTDDRAPSQQDQPTGAGQPAAGEQVYRLSQAALDILDAAGENILDLD